MFYWEQSTEFAASGLKNTGWHHRPENRINISCSKLNKIYLVCKYLDWNAIEMCFHGVSTNTRVLFRAVFVLIQFLLQVNGENFIFWVKKDFLKEPGANGQSALQIAVSNPTPRLFRPGVCPAAGSSSWHRLSVSWHKLLDQCLKISVENTGIRTNSLCGRFNL